MQDRKVYINGNFANEKEATIGLQDLALNRGYGVFDYFHIQQQVPMYLNEHLARLRASCETMHLSLPLSADEITDTILQLAKANMLDSTGIKILVTGGYSMNGYSLQKPNIIITAHPIPPKESHSYKKGISLITHAYQRDLPLVKSINYTKGLWLLPAIAAAGADDVVFHYNNCLLECPRSNFFVVTKNDEVLTAADGVLLGITRNNALSISRKHFNTATTTITMEMLQQAQEAFITSTTKGILPVTQIDGRPVGNGIPGSITCKLMDELAQWEASYQTNALTKKSTTF